jgi:ERCC4-type nuclease
MKAVVLIDSREKENKHILKRLCQLNIPFKVKKLDFGDYSFEWNGVDYSGKVAVERKASFSEISGNFTKGKNRFKNEFERASGAKVYLVIEETEDCLNKHLYRSTIPVKELRARLNTWCNKFQLDLKFTDKDQSADLILQCFRDFIKKEKRESK